MTINNDKSKWEIRPLIRSHRDGSGIYTREEIVESEIQILLGSSDRARRERLLNDGGRKTDTSLHEETLVYFVREYTKRGDTETAWKILELIVARIAGRFARKVAQWHLTSEDADDCFRDLNVMVIEAIRDTNPANEFWEVRFWTCLDRRLINLLKRFADVQSHEVLETEGKREGDEGDADSIFAIFPDTGISPVESAEQKEAFATLTPNERTALYLQHQEGLPEESDDPDRLTIARTMGVTGRTVRNYLRSARKKIETWNQTDH